ncbi:acetyl-coenzyme A synthetase 2-like, mitochondrial isoform X2 [Etheostoma spectabile]|uniref:acetyl-coenzyme A synthetase 2-like, mitochondrial isoform X2 n=1 Tax=Etheostoma spectabile TaxID=54343 RepID=UPI0013AFA23E|nr:acetyl-coenzyme A synthetase 2-like, mitochondrial isoform X2 [Etheostoma spectabile]
MWLSCGCASKYVVSFSRRVFKSYFHVLGRWRCNVAASMPEAAGFEGACDHSALQEFSVSNSASFWAAAARHRLSWISPFHTAQDCDLSRGKIKWFEGGKLNVSVNCLDRHVHTCPERVALIWERDEPGSEVKITYRQLLEMTCRLGNLLRRRGVRKGDCVTIYMPTCPLAVASMLACARIGAAHNVVFAGFSAEALAERIRDAQSNTVITVNQGVRGGKVIQLKKAVDTALQSCPTVQQVFVAMRTENPVAMTARDIVMEEYVFNYHDGDVFGCVADIGWITGHSYSVYGPLANGGTTVLFESTPIYPDPGRYWEMVQRLKINQFYGSPTAIRLLLKYGDQWVHKYDRSTLKTLGSVGEPINTEAWEWYHRVVGDRRCPVVDTWWQTETGGICITPRPSDPDAEIVPGMAMRPFFGIKPVLMDTEGNVLTSNDTSGALCIAQPWPGMARTIHNNHQRFIETYCQPYPGYFFTGDGAYRSKEGYYQITGRLDDVINVCGHRIGTAEIEDVVNQYSVVAESAIIGYPHDIKGQGVYAFVVLKQGVNVQEEDLSRQLNNMVSKKIAKYACPDFIQFVHRLPKTRSGKIMRRVLRKVVERDLNGLGDLSTLDDPAAVEEIIQGHRELCSKQP